MEELRPLAYLFLGWLLGLLGPAIQQRIKRRHDHKRVTAAIVTELTELRQQCASTTLVLEVKRGRLTKELLLWAKGFRNDRLLVPPLDKLAGILDQLEQIDETQLASLARAMKQPTGGGLNLKPLALPFTQSRVGDLDIFTETSQQRVLSVLQRIRIFNEYVEESRFFFKLTFDSGLSESNHASVSAQCDAAYAAASVESRYIADAISAALPDLRS